MSVVPVDRTLSILGGRHELHVQTVTFEDEYCEVAHTIAPPLPRASQETVLPRIDATDDRGRTYEDSGGAYGTAMTAPARRERSVAVPASPPTSAR